MPTAGQMNILATRTSIRVTQPLILAALVHSFTARSAFITSPHLRRASLCHSMLNMSSRSSSDAPMYLIDVDCNLLHPDIKSVMNSISTLQTNTHNVHEAFKILHHPSTKLSNIVAMISPSSTIDDSEDSVAILHSSVDLERNHIDIKTTVGVHPYHCLSPPSADELERLRALLNNVDTKQYICCIGETGLDYSDGFPEKENQLAWFKAQVDMAFEYNLPLFLHERLAFQDTLQCIDDAIERHNRESIPKIIVHCYTGSFDECIEYMKRGYYISVSGYIIKDGVQNEEVRQCLREGVIPLDKLMIETDAPYMGFAGNKDAFFDAEGESFNSLSSKKRKRLKSIYPNVPCALPYVLKAACNEINAGREQRGEMSLSLEELAIITTQNSKRFFGL